MRCDDCSCEVRTSCDCRRAIFIEHAQLLIDQVLKIELPTVSDAGREILREKILVQLSDIVP